ncbi:MAG: hypothetical protein AB1801_19030 [Chloroflexota bacterium]
MSLTEERLQILKMLEAGQINAEEAAQLLAALETATKKEQEPATPSTPPGQGRARWLRIRVTDEATGKRKVNVNLPLGMVNVALKVGAKFAPDIKDMNLDELFEAIKSGAEGKIVDVQDEEDGERVEIFVE